MPTDWMRAWIRPRLVSLFLIALAPYNPQESPRVATLRTAATTGLDMMMRLGQRRLASAHAGGSARRPPAWLATRPTLASASRCGLSTDTEAPPPRKLVKRKVAIVSGYLGSGYHGVQLNKDVDTIEHELRRAILQAGAMRDSNVEDLAKIDWSRSSRTDKGVHAGCIVVRAATASLSMDAGCPC
jgi:hypothetical protein